MSVILVRHADAENDSALGDSGRAITSLGRKQAHDTAAWLKIFVGQLPPVFLVSPYVRTTQTGEILVSAFAGSTLQSSPALKPGQTAGQAAELARSSGNLGLVGHQPMMGELAAELLGRPRFPFGFERAAALVLEPDGQGQLRFRAYRVPFGEVVEKL